MRRIRLELLILVVCVGCVHTLARGEQPGRMACPGAQSSRCNYGHCSVGFGFVDSQLRKMTSLASRNTRLIPRQEYASPLEASYYLRPYVPQDVMRFEAFMNDSKNPYDNRVFETLYDESTAKK